MADLIFLAISFLFFVLAIGYVVGCERLQGTDGR
jgi:hypothetical protein